MTNLLLFGGLVLAPYILIVAGLLVALVHGENLRARLRLIRALGTRQVLRITYKGILILVGGLTFLVFAVSAYDWHLAYQAAPDCATARTADCRDLIQLRVSQVDIQHGKTGDTTNVYFSPGNFFASFSADDVAPSGVPVGRTVGAEVWRGAVTALVIDGQKHESFQAQGTAAIGIGAGAGFILLGLTWVVADLVVGSIDTGREMRPAASRLGFAAPVMRRRTLYLLLPAFGLLLCLFGLALATLAAGAVTVANLIAVLYAIGAVLTLPALVVVFVAWFVRAYRNVGDLGLPRRHATWFVAAGLLLPPLNLYMPYRLLQEVVEKTRARVTRALLRNWWGCAVGWLLLTVAGLSLSTSDSGITTLQDALSFALLVGSVAAGLVGAALTLLLVRAIDGAELALFRMPV